MQNKCCPDLKIKFMLKAERVNSTCQPSFLGYSVSQMGVSMDDNNVNGVTEWLVTKTMKDLQHFLEFANFYWRFIWCFNSITTPLLKKESKILAWNSEAEDTFNKLKTIHHSTDLEASRPFQN